MKKIAILLSTHNRLSLTKETIHNVFSFAGIPFHLFWVDDNSNDETKQYLNMALPYGYCTEISKYDYHDNFGKAIRLNAILRDLYKKDFSHFCIIDNDVLLPLNWLKDCVSILDEDSSVGICGVLVEPSLLKDNIKAFGLAPKYILTSLMGGACMVWGTSVKDKVGVFCEDYGFYGHEDADFTYRCRAVGLTTVFLHNMGIHLGIESLDNNYKKTKMDSFYNSKSLLFDNMNKYSNKTKDILIK